MDYPCSLKTSDDVSITSQKIFLILSGVYFLFLGLAAFLGCFVLGSNNVLCRPFVWGIIWSLIISLLLKFIIKSVAWDRQWFDGRAVAESIKTATWRYVMGAKPFGLSMTQKDVDTKFIKEIKTIIESRPTIQKPMATCLSSGEQITNLMREIRGKRIDEKKKIYLKERVNDQREWYSKKAKYNGMRDNYWFIIITIVEIAAIGFACFMLHVNNAVFNPVGLFTTMATAFVAWEEIKKFRDLSQSYAMASQELASAASLAENVNDESSLAIYVHDTENAISREHTMWCAKRS